MASNCGPNCECWKEWRCVPEIQPPTVTMVLNEGEVEALRRILDRLPGSSNDRILVSDRLDAAVADAEGR